MTHEHHWVIDRPNGPTSKGVCRKRGCREVRDFPNSMDAGGFYSHVSKSRSGSRETAHLHREPLSRFARMGQAKRDAVLSAIKARPSRAYEAIAQEYGISGSTVSRIAVSAGMPKRYNRRFGV